MFKRNMIFVVAFVNDDKEHCSKSLGEKEQCRQILQQKTEAGFISKKSEKK